jgi:uncharacterized protein
MSGRVTDLFHYPIKGLSAQRLKRVELIPGEGFPFDRVFGLARHDSAYDPSHFKPLPKTQFIVLVREERLAELQTCFDPKTRRLEIRRAGNPALDEDLSTGAGIARTIDFFATMFDLGPEQRPIFADAGPNRFTDVSVVSREMMNAVSLINLASVRDLASRIGQELHPLRFRANIYFDGLPPFSELDLLDREITIGSVRLKVMMRTRRCAATEVNPETARRDIPVPPLLLQHLGHANMGVYAEVLNGGEIENGASVSY